MTEITLRQVKGAPLTYEELDANFANLKETADLAYDAVAGVGGKANAAALGVDDSATDLGTFTGTTISDNTTAKGALQELETALESTSGDAATKTNATAIGIAATDANMGTTPGTILSDNGTAKDWFRESEAAIEDRPTSADLAEPDASDALGFRQSSDPDAKPGFLLTKLREFVSVEDYYVGNPDDTDAVQKALERAVANGVECRAANRSHLIGGTVTNTGGVLRGAGAGTVFQKSGLGPLFISDHTTPTRQGYYVSDVAIHSWSITLANIAHAANFAVGDYAILAGNEFYDSPNLDPQKKGEFVRIKSIAGAVVTFYGPVTDSYATASAVAPELIPVSMLEGIGYHDLTCVMDTTVGVVGGGDSGTEQRHVITTKWALEPEFTNIRMKNSLGSGIALEGHLFARVRGHYAKNFGSASASDGTSTEGLAGYGYGIMERGLNFGLEAKALRYDSIRHGYSNGGDYGWKVGRPVGFSVEDGIHWNARAAGWDTHQTGHGGTMSNLKTIGGRSGGFSSRCDSIIWRNIAAIGCAAYAMAMWKGASENAENNVVDGLYIQETNFGTDAAEDGGVNWTTRGAIIDQGTSNTVKNVTVDSCYGPLYETGADVVAPALENVRAKLLNKVGVANKAIWLRATGLAGNPRISDVEIDATNSMITDLIRNDEATSFSNIPIVEDVSFTGSISGKRYSSGLVNDNFVHWTGPNMEGFRESLTLTGATTFSLMSRRWRVFQVARAAAETLVTVTGGVEGEIIEIIGGSTGITVTHSASGANTFFCKGAANCVINSGSSARFQCKGGIWAEISRSF